MALARTRWWHRLCRCKPTLDHPHLTEILLLAVPSSMSSRTLNRHFVETCVHPTCEQENKFNLLLYSECVSFAVHINVVNSGSTEN